MRYWPAVASALICALLPACNSIESTHIIRDKYGVERGEKFAGVPITVTIPEKIAFLATESEYLITQQTMDANGNAVGEPRQTRERRVQIDKTPIPLGPTELFALDTKRPASGTGKGSITLDAARQYPTIVANEVNDNTLNTVLSNLEEIKNTFKPQGGGTPGSLTATETVLSTRQYFIVYDPKTGTLTRMG